jgi:hypothetical protein
LLGIAFAAGEFDVGFDVAGELIFNALAVAKNALRFFLLAPKVGVGGAFFKGFQARAVLGSVKESSVRE